MTPLALIATWPGRIAALVLVGVLVGGVVLVARAGQPPAKPDLRTTTVTKGNITQTVSVSGSISAQGQARLSFKSAGRLAQVYVSVGQAVTPGQPLAKLDTTDLETALSTAQQNLANAQASYQKQLLAAEDTRKTLEETQRSTANDIANAQRALDRVKANYDTAKVNFGSTTSQVRADTASLTTSIGNLQANLDSLLAELTRENVAQSNDQRAAVNSVRQAQIALENARAYLASLMSPALADFESAQNAIVVTTQSFDNAAAATIEPVGVASSIQTQQLAYSSASSRLGSSLEAATGPLGSVQTSVAAAQTSLNTTAALSDPSLTQARAHVRTVLVMVNQTLQIATTAKSRLPQASSALTTISETIQTSYANAVQAVATAQDRAATSVRNAQAAVANIPFNLQAAQVSVDNAANSVTTAKNNLDNAILVAPAAGVVASIANQLGEFVSGSSTNNPFMVLTNTTSMVLHGTLGEADIAKVKLGQVANVTVDALSGQKMTGRVTSLDPVATISQGVPVYGIDVAIDIPASGLKAGMSGTAAVILASKQGVLTVPNTTIRSFSGQRGVQVLKDGEVVDAPVQFGIGNDTVTEVVSGLNEGDVVVIPQARAGATQRPGQFQQGPGPVIR